MPSLMAGLKSLSEGLLVLGRANPRPLSACTLNMITELVDAPQRPRGVNGFYTFDDKRAALGS